MFNLIIFLILIKRLISFIGNFTQNVTYGFFIFIFICNDCLRILYSYIYYHVRWNYFKRCFTLQNVIFFAKILISYYWNVEKFLRFKKQEIKCFFSYYPLPIKFCGNKNLVYQQEKKTYLCGWLLKRFHQNTIDFQPSEIWRNRIK